MSDTSRTVQLRHTFRLSPLLMLATVGLIIAKVVFGLTISWVWAFAPLWLPFGIVLGIFLIFAAVSLIVGALICIWQWLAALSDNRWRRKAQMFE